MKYIQGFLFNSWNLARLAFFLCLLTAMNGVVSAQTVSAAIQPVEIVVKETVSASVADLLEKFNQERQFYETEPDRFFSKMDAALSKIVDFRRIAARVMGRYARKATKEQKNKFVNVFKKSLYATYTKTLIESGVNDINVTKARINSRSDKKATVDLNVISANGTVFPVIYSMHKTKDDRWLLENVIVFGVNVGLAFRDRFEKQVRKNKGDIDLVIDSWTVNLDIKKPKGA